ncbi:MAG TPA: hypothetical protein PLM05_09880, partial [Bacteroidales bacterium]|nr:hypothetical protein [Bacteroidales bacterium]
MNTGSLMATAEGNTVNYERSGDQTVKNTTYYNLTLSGSGSKTNTGVSVNGTLSLEGTATVPAAISYGPDAALYYNTSNIRTVTNNEWPATFSGTGGVVINAAATVSLNQAKVLGLNVPLVINSGASFNTANNELTFGGNFNNNGGEFNAGSSDINISNSGNQDIAGFTTTGRVSMTKSSGTVTLLGNISGTGFTVNGAGSIHLGNDLVHTFSGDFVFSNGTITGGSSTLRLGGTTSVTGGNFNAGTGTVEFYGGSQNVPGTTYHNLTISGGSTKSVINNHIRINGNLTLNNGILSLGNHDLTLGLGSSTNGSFSETSMIDIGTRTIVKEGNSASDFILTLPVGNGTAYTPVHIADLSVTSISPSAVLRVQTFSTPASGVPGKNPLKRHWITSTNGISGPVLADISFTYASNDIPDGGNAGVYEIVYRPSSGSWGTPDGASAPGSNPLRASAASSLNATWTGTIQEYHNFYSFSSGSWDNPGTWTLDPSGTQWLNPGNFTPSTSPTSDNDEVTILSGRTVTVPSDNKKNKTINIEGTLDLGTTTGHSFTVISGTGRIRLAGDNFPSGDATSFISDEQGKSVTEFYGNSRNLITPRNFSNVEVNLNGSNTLFLETDYLINGNLTVSGGILSIGSSSLTNTLNITASGDLVVQESGRISTGTANARHQLNLFGDFINKGEARFTNRTAPEYMSEAINGIVDLRFLSDKRNQTIMCNGLTNFYRIEIDKGEDYTYVLNIEASEPGNFNLLGFANENHGSISQLTINRNALGLLKGTVRIGNNVEIPVLSQAGNYNISQRAQLWIDRGMVRKNSGTAIVVYGKVKISNGTLEALINSGITFRENGLINVEGGTLNANQIRTTTEGITTYGGYVQTGGTVNVVGGNTNTSFYVFSLPFPTSVFNMSGGTLKVNTSSANGAILINSGPENIKVTGGTVIAETQAGRDYQITSTAPFWNLELRNSTTARRHFRLTAATNIGPPGNQVNVPAQTLHVLNEFRIWGKESGGDNYPEIVFDPEGNDLYIGGSFFIEAGAVYSPVSGGIYPYDAIAHQPTGRNTTYFNRTAATRASEQLYWGEAVTQLEFGNLVIDRPNGHEVKLTSVSSRINESVLLDINGDATVRSGILNQNLYTIRTWGAIENNERMGVWMPGVTPSRAQIQFVENPALTLTTGQDAVFGNVQVNVTPPSVLTLSSDVYIERMEYVKGLIYLKNYNLKIDNLWNLETALFENIPTTSFLRVSDNGRSGSSMIYSDGKASDGGLTLRIAANSQAENENNILNNFGPVTFPVGFSSDGGTVLYFRPAQIVVKEVSSPGYITVRPVMGQLKTTDQSGGEILQHYWRVSHSGFTSLPLVAYRFYYRGQRGVSNVDLPAGASAELQYVPGKVLDQNPYTRLFEPLADNDIIRNIGPSNTRVITFNGTSNNGSFSPSSAGFTLENSNYTAGVSPRFTGSPIHYYSNPAGGAWHVAGTWDVGSKGSGIHAVPTTGSIVHIYNDNTNPNVQGTSRINVQSAGMPHFPAEIIFEMPNIPVEQSHSENIPRLQFHASGTYDLGFVRGRGMISYGANSIITNGDFGDFGTNSGSYYLFFSGPSQLTTIPAPIPNMMIEYSTNINQNIVVNYDLIIQGNALVQPLQDIDIRRDLVMGFWRGATFQFPATGRTVKVTVGRDIDFTRIPIANEIGNRIINTAPTAGTLEHTLVLKGSIIQGNNNNFSINLFGASNRSKAILELQGSEDAGYSRNSNSVPEFYRIVMDKGKNQSSSFTFNNHFNLRGPTNTDVKAITLQNGTLILNNPSINLDLTTGGNNFAIPASSCLEINQGTVRASGNSGISLDGMLSINGGIVNMSGGHNSIEYSASGNASIKITGGTLTVGGQIRRSPTSDVGVLNYFQSGGTVITGNNSAQVSNRGVFEILNPGSSFTMTGGNLHIARSQISPSIPAFYFDPDIVNTGTSATIHIGHGVTPAAQTIGIFAGKPLPRLIINNASGRNPAAKLEVVPAAITSLLQIDAGATFNANGLDLHLNGDMTVTGSYTPQGNTTFFSGGGTQTVNIGGSGVSFYNLDKTSSENLVLNGSNTTVSVAGSLYLRAGTFTDNGNSVTVRGNVLNDAIHVNNGSSGDGIIMNGDTPQKLFGNGIFGKLTINNGYGVSVTTGSQFTITRSLKMVKGVLNIGSSLLELGVNAEIEEASPFSATNMIETNISFTDNGLKKIFRAGSSPAFTFPMGSDNKYTPVIFNISANGDNTGSITVKPANEIHPAIIEDTETGAQIVDRDNALQYYWTLNAEGISGFSAEARMFYNENDIRVTAPYTIADYHTASLLEAGSGNWQKFPQTDFDEINKYLIFRFSETDDQGIRGDYTAGAGDATLNGAIPDMVSVYETVNNGNWSTAAVWNPAIAGGPRGAIARINAAHTIDVTTNNIAGYKTEIFGTLKLYSTSGHRLGIVNGNGTVYLEKGEIPAAVYEDFFSPAGGTIEFGGTTAYGFLGTVARVNNLSFSGSGERRFSNNNLTVNGNITIAGSSGLKVINQFNSRISIRGNLNRSSGLFDSGSGSNATLAFTGTMPQTISGSFTGINSLNNLEINNTSDVNILNNLEIKGDIRFINGLLNVDPGALLRLRLSAQALPESGLPQSFVNGTLIKELMNGNSFTFPVGSYQTVRAHGPLMLKNVSGPSGINDWGVTYFFSSPTLAGYNTANFESPVSTVSNSEYWKIEGPEGGKSVIRIILDGSSDVASSLPDLSNLRVVGWNPSADQWEIVGTSTAVSGTAVSGMITTSTAVDYDSYKYFTLASVTPVAIGSATITSPSEVNLCSGSSTAITVNFTGEMPYILTYTAGTVTHTTPAVNSPTYIITVSPAATTVYTLAAVSANGQPGIITGTSSVTVNVSPVPAVSLSSSVSGSVCEGSTVTFTATAGLANYSFRVNGNIVQDGAGNIFVTSTLPPGSQSVDVIATNTAGCSATSSAISLTVNPLPAAAGPVEGPVSVCLGDPRSFTVDPIAGATSYIWSATNGAQIATNGNRFNTITFPNAGETIVTVRGRNSCGDGIPSSITVIVSNLPPPGAAGPVSGPSQVCRGGSGYVYSVSSVANATSYIWEYTGSNAVIHGTGNSVTVDFLSGATSGSLRVRGTNGCADGAFSDNFSITVNQPPSVVINPTDPSVCSGTGLPITATASGGLSPYSYSWNGNGASFL